MFDVKKLPKSPGLARRLLQFSQLNGLLFDESIVDLATQDLIDPKEIANGPYPLDSAEIQALQHVCDWNGRAMLLEAGHERARRVALAHAYRSQGTTLVLAQPRFYAHWAEEIRKGWPSAKISVFGNPRYIERDQVFPEGIEFAEKPDWDAEFFITSYGGLIFQDFVSNKTVDQAIVEELDNIGAINYRWQEAVNGAFNELPRPLFIQNIYNLPNDPGRDNVASIQTSGSKAINFMSTIVGDLLWSGIPVARPLMGLSIRDAEEYLSARGYAKLDMLAILSLFGISSHLLEDADGHRRPLTFWDNTIKNLPPASRKNTENGLGRFIQREADLRAKQGMSTQDIVRVALGGDHPVQTLLGQLKTNQWANLKANHMKLIHNNVANKLTKCLFLVDNPDVHRNVRLHFGAQVDDLSDTGRDRFMLQTTPWYNGGLRPVANLIVSWSELVDNPDLLDQANFLFLSELPMDPEEYAALQSLVDSHGTRLVQSVIADTFEEALHKQLTT